MRTAILRTIQILCLALLPAAAFAQSCQTDVDCASSGNVCNIASCNTTTHTCQTTPISCNSGNACEVNSRCVASVDSSGQQVAKCEYDAYLCPPPTSPCKASACTNVNGIASCPVQPLSCPTDNGCMVGSCSIQNGQAVCSYTAAPDGSACNDGNACHQGGTCQAGACSASPIVCGGAAQCNPQTGACSSASTVPPLFTNGDFVGTVGVAPPSPWTVTIGSSGGGFNGPVPRSYSNLNLTTLQPGQGFGSFLIPGTNIIHSGFEMLTFVESAAGGPFSQTDSNVGSGISWPRYGNQAVIVNQGGTGGNFNTLSQTATVTAANFDPADSKVHIRFAFAPVVGRGLGSTIDPYYFIQVTNVTQGTILYTDFGTAGNGNQPWQTATNTLDFTPWQLVSVAESAPAINVGDSIELQIVAACDGDEYGDGALTKVWVDGVGANVPGISVEGSAQANAGTGADTTYTLNYQNQGAQTETNVTVNFTLPANTTYQSLNAPYGATCTNPNIGVNGTVSCNVGSLAPGASGTLSINASFPNAAISALPYRNYGISSDQETTLLGPPISVAGLGVASVVYGSAAGSGSDIVSAPSGAAWSASTNLSWITLTNSSGTGAGLVTFTYSANPGATRTGTITFSASMFQLTLTITQAGASYAQTSQLNTVVSATTGLGQPYGVAVDGGGNLYIADGANNSVEEWNSTNGLTKLFALTSSSNPSNDLSPVGVTLDGLGNVYAEFNSSSLYRSIYEWNPISATAQGLQIPQTNARAVAVDNGGDLYIANTSEVFEWLPSPGVHYKHLDSAALGVAVDLAGNVYESLDGTGVKELPVSGQSSVLFYPGTDLYGLAVDGAGNVYAATQGATASILQWNPVTQQTTTLISSGLTTPQGIAVDGIGNIYIADSGSNTIYELPYAFVPTAIVTETAAAGSDQLLPVLPATAPVTAASDSSWLTIGTITNGVVSFSFTQNVGLAARTAHITILGQSIPVTQSGQVPASLTANTGTTPQSTSVNTAFASLAVTVKDSGGNAVSGANVTFTAPSTGPSGVFSNGTNTITVQTSSSGVAFAPFTANTTAGSNYSVTATVGQLSTPFTLTNTAGAAASITANTGTTPQSATINTAFANPLAVTVKDSYGNLVSGANVVFTAPSAGPSGIFSNSTNTITVQTSSSGVASAPFTANSQAGGPSYNVTATVGQFSTSFTLANTAGAAASLTANTGTTPQSTIVNTAFANSLAVTMKDSGGNPVSGANVTFTAPSTGPSGVFSNSTNTITVQTSSSGVAFAPFTANTVAGGTYNVTATVGQLSTPFSLTNTAGAAASITANTGTTPQSATINTAFANPLAVTVKDTYGNPVSGASVLFQAGSQGPSGLFSNNTISITVATNSAGIASAPFTANSLAGGPSYNVTATAGPLSTSFYLTNTAGVAASITANAGTTPQSATVNTAFPVALAVTVKDSGGNPVSGSNVVFTAPSTGPSGVFSNSTSNITVQTNASGVASAPFTANASGGGSYNVTAMAGQLTTSFVLTNNFLTQTIQNFGTIPAQTVGTPLLLTATATSGLGVSYQSTTLTVCTLNGSTVTFLTPGPCSLTASQAGNTSYAAATPVTQQFTVNPNTPTISNLQAVAVGGNSELITWTTDQPSTTQVTYGVTSTPLDSNLVTFHSVTLTGLSQNTAYTYNVSSTNSTNGTATSQNATFTVTPLVGYVAFWGVNNSGVTISWSTDFAATTFVAYGTTTALGQTTPVQTALSNGHGVVLTGLNPGTTYYFRAESTDANGHTGASTIYTFTTTGAPASPAPVITNVTVTSITTTSATITWTTDQASSSQVNYGTTTAYGSSSTLNSSLITSHSVTLTGLIPGTTYNYDVISTNSSGTSSGMSTNYTFQTTAIVSTPPAISNIQSSVTSTTATITWTTDQAANSSVNYVTSATTPDSSYVTSHSVTLTGLTPGTLYNFTVISKNAAGLSTTSPSGTFTTTASSATPPQVGYVAFWGVNNSGVTISWSTDVPANTQLAYGTTPALGQLTPVQTTLANSHGVVLTGLSSGTTYYFVAQSTGSNGATGSSTTYSFTTTGTPSAPAPVITTVQANTTNSSVTITWNTDQAATSQVNYGPTTSYTSSSTLSSALVTTHSVTISNLLPGTTYHFDVVSANSSGTSATSSDSTFTTTGSAPGPVISSVAASSITSGTALITWTTDQASSSQVNYGNTSTSTPALVTSHSVTLSGLTPNTMYTFYVTSTNAASVSTTSSNYTFTTSTASASAPVISYLAFWGVTNSSVVISWSTDVPSNTSVAYGTTSALGLVTPVQPALTNSHGLTLTGLQPSTTYYFEAQSADVNGNTGTSTLYTFTTLAGGAPMISTVLTTPSSSNTATITWTTSVPAYSYVQYGPSHGNYNRYSAQTNLTTTPQCTLPYVPSGTVYYQLVSTDASGNQTVSPEATFIEP